MQHKHHKQGMQGPVVKILTTQHSHHKQGKQAELLVWYPSMIIGMDSLIVSDPI